MRDDGRDSADLDSWNIVIGSGYLPLAHRLARRYQNRGVPLEDLEQVAALGLVRAVDRFDPDQGGGFVAFAIPTITGEIRRHFRDRTWSVHVPRRFKDLQGSINKAASALFQQLGRAPRPSELAAHLNLPVGEVLEGLQAIQAYQSDSLDQTLDAGRSSGPDPGAGLGDLLGQLDPALEQAENHHALRPLLAELPERERTILALRFYASMTQSQIGERLGISQMHVSRLLSKTLTHLRQGLNQD